jgi:antitoxin HicB
MRYPVDLIKDEDGNVTAYAKDSPGAHTFGEDEAEALARIVDAIETIIAGLITDREPIPRPTAPCGRPTVALPALTTAKISLYNTMRQSRVSKSELSRRLNWHMPQVDRVLDLNHASKLEQIEAAFKALGKELRIEVRRAA